jgi:hypothetical protein
VCEDREEILARERRRIRFELEIFARAHSLVGPGEQLIFELYISAVPLVVEKKHVMDMTVNEFFTIERFVESGIPLKQASFISGSVTRGLHAGVRVKDSTERLVIDTIRELVIAWPKIKKIDSVGSTGRKYIVRALNNAEIFLDE